MYQSGPQTDAKTLQDAKSLRAEVAADLLRLSPRRRIAVRLLLAVRRLAIWCETAARRNLEGRE